MKKVLFDLTKCQPKGATKFHGGGAYGYALLSALLKTAPNNVVIYYDANKFVKPTIKSDVEKLSVKLVDCHKKTLTECISENEIDVFYSPSKSDSYKELLRIDIPIVMTIHGMRNLEMNRDKTELLYARTVREKLKAVIKLTPYYSYLWNQYWRERRWIFENRNIHIITVSNHSKDSILFYYPQVNRENLQVMYSFSTAQQGYENTQVYSAEKYYLIVSANRWLKNAYRALMAFDKLFDNPAYGIDGKVVVLGLSENTTVYKRLRNKDRFELKGYVEQEELESLYKGAYAFVYPSLNEGFGYPPLEAMKYGTPVIASSFASITEVCGDAVLYANPYSIDEIAFRILELEDSNTYSVLKSKALERYKVIETKQNEDLQRMVNLLLEYVK